MRDHNPGEIVSYRQNGICRINRMIKENFGGLGVKEYYELSPIYDTKTVIYVPVDSEDLVSGMRHVLTADEIDEIIERSEAEELPWVNDTKERNNLYTQILQGGDRTKILLIIKTISIRKKELEEKKKKLYAGDAKLLLQAEKAIVEEFSFVLGIKRDDVIPYIIEKLEQ